MTDSAALRYLCLGLQLGRHVEGIVDAYFGPASLAAEVAAQPPPEPDMLVVQAQALLDELDDGWLRDQMVGVRTFAGVLAGEAFSYADEVEGCYGVRPTHTDESVFAAAHERLEQLLPGPGPLLERHQRWQESMLVPTDLIEPTVQAIIDQARTASAHLVAPPAGEGVVLHPVRDKPWLGFNDYLGDLRGQVSINVDLEKSALELLHLSVHETYPGHQLERCSKEHLLVRGRGLLEETLVLVPTPQAVISEGLAELAPQVMLDGEHAAAFEAIIHRAGVPFDLAHARAVERASQPCRWAEVNAALMLHQDSADPAEVQAYLQRWGVMSPQLAAHLVRFLHEPTSRTYMIAYPAGRELCEAYVAGEPARLRRLLTEQVRVGELVAAGQAALRGAAPS